MAWTTLPGAGSRLYASTLSALITELRPVFAHKTADEPLISTTTYQADDHLSLAFSAGVTYTIESWFAVEGPTTGDIKMRLAWTGTLTRIDFGQDGLATTAASAEGDLKSVAQLGATTSPTSEITLGTITSNWSNIKGKGLLIASTAGTLTLEWAPVASVATNTIIKKGSWMKLIPTGA